MNEGNALFEDALQQAEDPSAKSVPAVQSQEFPPAGEAPEQDLTPTATEETPVAEEPAAGPEAPVAEEPAAGPEAPVAEEPAAEPEPPADDVPAEQEAAATGEEAAPSAPLTEKPPYHTRYYLRYCGGKRTMPLDLNGTRSFLQDLGFDGGELRQARKGKDCAESFAPSDKTKNNQAYCSYCGVEISGVDFYRLPDGRLRCTSCNSTVVKTKAEVEELCSRVISHMDSFFGASIDVPVAIEVLDERKLKKKIGASLGTKDDQSILILGVAINKKKKYSILLENGAPRISLIATFAHELTHIWQYTHWDNNKNLKKCPKNNRLLIYEGMAKWAEIQYLYLVGETNVARREERLTRERQDEYGIGFCLYEDRYPLTREAMLCEDTPFTPDRYPFD